MHDRPLVHLDDTFRCGWPVSKGAVRPNGVVVSSPGFDDDPRLLECVEEFAVKQFVAEAGIKALAMAIFPRRVWLDECSL